MDVIANMFVGAKAFGFSICPDGSYSYFSRPGTNNHEITSQDFKQEGFVMNTNCKK